MFTFHFGNCLCQSPHLLEVKSCTGNHVSSGMTHRYGIHHRRVFRSSYRKLAWVGFEPTTTEFCWDTLNDWAIGSWVHIFIFIYIICIYIYIYIIYILYILCYILLYIVAIYVIDCRENQSINVLQFWVPRLHNH